MRPLIPVAEPGHAPSPPGPPPTRPPAPRSPHPTGLLRITVF
ncbi:hypothetical protein D187_009397 [Cystobacter fuscus DSM 2262]|uniref:Uncharacterized protein n=1 Tax=Cystobacter fuscus (strain ATCC 25194 / DSM 2262 / NBRC 100088 / M29) TaxID=1242864 RepID=S9NSW9_CYSF2|nr:hypothetical protein D187_009397 [Cystobacter fuscus DSM 2262]